MKGKIFKIKKDKLETWKTWCLELNSIHKKEALETLVEEGLSREYGGIFELHDGHYGYILTDKEGKPSNKDRELNRIHLSKIKESIDTTETRPVTLNNLYSLETNKE